MPVKIITGKYAYVDGVPCTTGFNLSRQAAVVPYSASCVAGAIGAVEGNINITGNMRGIGFLPPKLPGDEFAFKGVADNEAGDAKAYDGTAIVGATTITIPVEQGGPITWNSTIGLQGDWSIGTVGAEEDLPTESRFVPPGKFGQFLIGKAAPVAVDAVRNMTITLTRALKTYVQGGLTYREAGNLSAAIAVQVYGREPDAAYAANVHDVCTVVVGPSTGADVDNWWFGDILFSGISGLDVNAETQDLIGFTINGTWNAIHDNAGVADGGFIRKPYTGTIGAGDWLYGQAPA